MYMYVTYVCKEFRTSCLKEHYVIITICLLLSYVYVKAELECTGDLEATTCGHCPQTCDVLFGGPAILCGMQCMGDCTCSPSCSCPRDKPYSLGGDRCGTEEDCRGKYWVSWKYVSMTS